MPAPETIIVMYHYVRPVDRTRWGGVFPLEPAEFEQQLDYLTGLGDIIRPDELDDPAAAGPRIVLTFDDGTRDHYDHVFPILRRRGYAGLFGLISGPALGQRLPNVHLIHWLTSNLSDADLWAALAQAFPPESLGDPAMAAQLYTRDTPLRGRSKFALNFALTHDEAGAFLTAAVARCGQDPHALADAWYLAEHQVKEMHAAGMQFAIHAHGHRAYAGPPATFWHNELEPCAQWLTGLLGQPPRFYIAAFGGSNARGHAVTELGTLLRERGFRHGFLTERGTEPAPLHAFFLKRLDCADLPPRRARDQYAAVSSSLSPCAK